jgi:hypothetical protein
VRPVKPIRQLIRRLRDRMPYATRARPVRGIFPRSRPKS